MPYRSEQQIQAAAKRDKRARIAQITFLVLLNCYLAAVFAVGVVGYFAEYYESDYVASEYRDLLKVNGSG